MRQPEDLGNDGTKSTIAGRYDGGADALRELANGVLDIKLKTLNV